MAENGGQEWFVMACMNELRIVKYLLAAKRVQDTNNGQVGDGGAIGSLERVSVLDSTLGVQGGEDEGLNVLRGSHGCCEVDGCRCYLRPCEHGKCLFPVALQTSCQPITGVSHCLLRFRFRESAGVATNFCL